MLASIIEQLAAKLCSRPRQQSHHCAHWNVHNLCDLSILEISDRPQQKNLSFLLGQLPDALSDNRVAMIQYGFGIIQQRLHAKRLDIQGVRLRQVLLIKSAWQTTHRSIAVQCFQRDVAKHPGSKVGPLGVLVEVAKCIGDGRLQNVCRLIRPVQRTRAVNRQLMLERFKMRDESLSFLTVWLSQLVASGNRSSTPEGCFQSDCDGQENWPCILCRCRVWSALLQISFFFKLWICPNIPAEGIVTVTLSSRIGPVMTANAEGDRIRSTTQGCKT